jgi:hypothetical protein
MSGISRKIPSHLKWAVLLLASSGCAVPNQPVPTFWQRLGIPQADAGFRAGVLNRSGEFPQLEKKPPLLPIADPQNLESENPLLKNAAEIKKDKDLKQQKIKALKYLASVGCVCPTEKDKVAEALLQGLNDCDCEVRQAAMEAICAAIKNCGPCNSAGCGSSCCTKAIQDKLQEMATKQDDKGCWSEPSATLRRQAAAVLAACPPIEPEKKDNKDIDIEPKAGEDVDENSDSEPSASDKENSVIDSSADSASSKSMSDYGDFEVQTVVYSAPTTPAPATVVSDPNLVAFSSIETLDAAEQVKITMPAAFRIEVGAIMVLVDSHGQMTRAQLLEIEGAVLTVRLEKPELKEALVEFGGKVGLVAN